MKTPTPERLKIQAQKTIQDLATKITIPRLPDIHPQPIKVLKGLFIY